MLLEPYPVIGWSEETVGIMCLYQPLPHFIASNTDEDGHTASREEAGFRRTQPVRTLTGGVGRGKSSHKLTAALAG